MAYLEKTNSWMVDHGLYISVAFLYRTHKVMIVKVDRNPPCRKIYIAESSDPFHLKKHEGFSDELL